MRVLCPTKVAQAANRPTRCGWLHLEQSCLWPTSVSPGRGSQPLVSKCQQKGCAALICVKLGVRSELQRLAVRLWGRKRVGEMGGAFKSRMDCQSVGRAIHRQCNGRDHLFLSTAACPKSTGASAKLPQINAKAISQICTKGFGSSRT